MRRGGSGVAGKPEGEKMQAWRQLEEPLWGRPGASPQRRGGRSRPGPGAAGAAGLRPGVTRGLGQSSPYRSPAARAPALSRAAQPQPPSARCGPGKGLAPQLRRPHSAPAAGRPPGPAQHRPGAGGEKPKLGSLEPARRHWRRMSLTESAITKPAGMARLVDGQEGHAPKADALWPPLGSLPHPMYLQYFAVKAGALSKSGAAKGRRAEAAPCSGDPGSPRGVAEAEASPAKVAACAGGGPQPVHAASAAGSRLAVGIRPLEVEDELPEGTHLRGLPDALEASLGASTRLPSAPGTPSCGSRSASASSGLRAPPTPSPGPAPGGAGAAAELGAALQLAGSKGKKNWDDLRRLARAQGVAESGCRSSSLPEDIGVTMPAILAGFCRGSKGCGSVPKELPLSCGVPCLMSPGPAPAGARLGPTRQRPHTAHR